MFDFIQNLTEFLTNLQDTFLGKTLKNPNNASYSNKLTKKIFTSGASLELNTKKNASKEKLDTNVKAILKKYKNDPNKLIAFVRKNGTKVYKIRYAQKILSKIGLEQGFISELMGLKALALNVLTSFCSGKKLSFSLKSEPVFILDTKGFDVYTTIQHFHKWYAMKLNLPGFESEAQTNFQKFMTSSCDANIKELNISEILELKEAIARDAEAITFVVNLAKSTEGSKKAWGKITVSGASV